uniref:Uncharacterized protein n=1 Tax=Molossus molossus TaxID=27622 RepID=A0A7J8EEN3_MOLMO|nr:hypothetical protein HJG59_008914 [Molossus molossus]
MKKRGRKKTTRLPFLFSAAAQAWIPTARPGGTSRRFICSILAAKHLRAKAVPNSNNLCAKAPWVPDSFHNCPRAWCRQRPQKSAEGGEPCSPSRPFFRNGPSDNTASGTRISSHEMLQVHFSAWVDVSKGTLPTHPG